MSLLIAVVGSERVVFATDTLRYRDRTPSGMVPTKTFIGSGFAIATRGNVGAIETAIDFLVGKPDFRSAVASVDEAFAAVRSHSKFDQDVAVELTIAGLVDFKPRCRRFSLAGVDLPMGPGAYCFPDLGRPLPAQISEKQLVKVAQVVERVARERRWNLCIGGRLHLTTVDRAGARQEEIEAFGGIDALAA
ncbi:hypothetical protein T8K17_13390 [Thalassobaculum sp. OXR-137]|uniref:hypothetical protein n=1 Tax=Thalassobaculum sp. OXR-137 TaxID=3100173 RepID=UPI002AC8A146|nr:hypothetical protein [Thalassobaculum sp. OXR-137]WPZ32236.1 hypothetical protein T8K17_13390 [Thalassobaculum sp. OXR-137]